MNAEDILKMEAGREMDLLVSKLIVSKKIPATSWHNGETIYYEDINENELRKMPDYSTDISAAWEVVKKLKEISAFVEVTLYDCGHNSCKLNPFKNIYVEADTAPLAICRAALLTTLGQE